MSTRLKLTDSIVINADEIVDFVAADSTNVYVRTTVTYSQGGGIINQFIITTGAGQNVALEKAIKKALTSSPSGRVIAVPASSDYTITNFTIESQY